MDLNNRKIVQKEIISELLNNVLSECILIEQHYLRNSGIKNISLSEMNMINTIAKDINPNMSMLANRLHLTNGTITTAIKNLEKKNYVKRYEDDYDHRYKRVKLTPKGQHLYQIHLSFQEEIVNQLCSHQDFIPDEKLIHFLSVLSRLMKQIKIKEELEK